MSKLLLFVAVLAFSSTFILSAPYKKPSSKLPEKEALKNVKIDSGSSIILEQYFKKFMKYDGKEEYTVTFHCKKKKYARENVDCSVEDFNILAPSE